MKSGNSLSIDCIDIKAILDRFLNIIYVAELARFEQGIHVRRIILDRQGVARPRLRRFHSRPVRLRKIDFSIECFMRLKNNLKNHATSSSKHNMKAITPN
jgi:hypothetical protein